MATAATEPTTVTAAELQASTAELLAQVKETGRSLSVAGGWVVLTASEYERLLDQDRRLGTLHLVQKGLRQVDEGQGRSLDDVSERLRQRHFGDKT
jgi:hypothetical protein